MPYGISLPTVERRSLDNSILSTNGRCPRLALFNYHLARAPRAENIPINFGSAYHDFMDFVERTYQDEPKVVENLTAIENLWLSAYSLATLKWNDPPIEHKKSYLDLSRLTRTLREGFDTWVTEKTRGFYRVIGTETPFELPLPRLHCRVCFTWHEKKRDDKGRFLAGNSQGLCPHCRSPLHVEFFSGKMDQILEWNRRLWIRDWKTTGRKDDWSRKFNPDHQFSGYVWAGEQLSGREISGVIVHIVYNIKTKGPEFYPTLCSRNKLNLRDWQEWVEYEVSNYRRSEATGIWPMRTSSCNDYGGCFFRDACHSGDFGYIERWLEERTIFSVWDPLNPEREEGLPE